MKETYLKTSKMTLAKLIDIFGKDLATHFWNKYSYVYTDSSGSSVERFDNVKFNQNLSGDSRNIYSDKSLWKINKADKTTLPTLNGW